MWWHGWNRELDFNEIAGSLICGHLIECSAYVTGGYYSGFKDLMDECENCGFPIAEIFADGSCIIGKEPNTGGAVREKDTSLPRQLRSLQELTHLLGHCWHRLVTATLRNPGPALLWFRCLRQS